MPSVGAGGTTYRVNVKSSPPGVGAVVKNAFALSDASTVDSGSGAVTLNLKIIPGLIALAGTLVWSDGVSQTPTGMDPGTGIIIPLEGNESVAYVLATFTSDSPQKCDSVTIAADTALGSNDGNTVNIPLGTWGYKLNNAGVKCGLVIGTGGNGIGNQVIQDCGGGWVFGSYDT